MAVLPDMHLEALHKRSSHHRHFLFSAQICGCFYCLREFPAEQITEWIDNSDTALCPFCGIDSVLGFDGEAADKALLGRMREYWFERTVRL